jgi:hypothetical protein
LAVGEQLGNSELVTAARSFLDSKCPLSHETVLPRALGALKYNLPMDSELAFFALYFSELSNDTIKQLPVSVLDTVLQDPHLSLKSDSHLLRLILKAGPDYHCLLRHVNFSYVDRDTMQLFSDSVAVESIDAGVWRQIAKVLVETAGLTERAEGTPTAGPTVGTKSRKKEFRRTPGQRFTGILNYLNTQANRNCHNAGLVNITASSAGECAPVSRLVDYNRTDWFYTLNLKNSWIKLDFKARKVWVEAYEIKGGRQFCTNLRTWVFEGSDDDQDWMEIGEVRHSKLMQGESISREFLCTPSRPFRFVRLKQTDLNDKGNDSLVLANIEIYGFLLE